jgi:hypothetical protein
LIAAGLIIFVATGISVFRKLFQLDPWWAIISLAVAVIFDIAGNLLCKRRSEPSLFLIAALCSNACCQFFCAMLMIRSTAWGAAVFSGLLLVCAGYNGHLFRATPRQPYMAFGTLMVVLAAALLSPTTRHLSIIAVSGPVSVILALLIGTFSEQLDRQRAETEMLRADLTDQKLKAESARADQLAAVLKQVEAGYNDLRNTLVTAAETSPRTISRVCSNGIEENDDVGRFRSASKKDVLN